MKLYELLELLDENMELWVNVDGEHSEHYDGRNSIDEAYMNADVDYITRDAGGVLTIEVHE